MGAGAVTWVLYLDICPTESAREMHGTDHPVYANQWKVSLEVMTKDLAKFELDDFNIHKDESLKLLALTYGVLKEHIW